jgi:hypothetical protein
MSPTDHKNNGTRQIAMMISEKNYTKLSDFKKQTRIPKAVLVDMALTNFFEKEGFQLDSSPTPIDRIEKIRDNLTKV